MTSEIPTCGAELIRIGPEADAWCTLPYGHHGPHTSSTGARREGQVTLNPNAPQVHRIDRCANLTCSNRPGGGTFTIFVAGPALHEPMRKAITLALCAPCGEAMKAVWPR